jgi:hypothetical protein
LIKVDDEVDPPDISAQENHTEVLLQPNINLTEGFHIH